MYNYNHVINIEGGWQQNQEFTIDDLSTLALLLILIVGSN